LISVGTGAVKYRWVLRLSWRDAGSLGGVDVTFQYCGMGKGGYSRGGRVVVGVDCLGTCGVREEGTSGRRVT